MVPSSHVTYTRSSLYISRQSTCQISFQTKIPQWNNSKIIKRISRRRSNNKLTKTVMGKERERKRWEYLHCSSDCVVPLFQTGTTEDRTDKVHHPHLDTMWRNSPTWLKIAWREALTWRDWTTWPTPTKSRDEQVSRQGSRDNVKVSWRLMWTWRNHVTDSRDVLLDHVTWQYGRPAWSA